MLTFPTHIFRPKSIQIKPISVTLEGGESLSGEQDVLQTDGGGRWQISMSGIMLDTPDKIRAWRAWEDTLYGGTIQCIVPVADIRQAPRPVVSGVPTSPGPLANGSADPYFPEAVGYATPYIVATIVDAAALRATQVKINVSQGSALKGGEVFALNHATKGRRIYRIARVISRPTGTSAIVQIRTPLREAVAGGMAADFDWPSVVCTLLPSAEISPNLQQGHFDELSIVFVESVRPPAP